MKRSLFLALLGCLLLAGCIIYVPQPGYEADDYYEEGDYTGSIDTSYFYDYLEPHGYWTDISRYGYVWVPHSTGYNWRPYTHGRWAWTDHGWTWISDYKWGWAPFHYGRWGWDDYIGWYWVPGNTWGPAWVSWRRGSTYLGWAPIPPGVRYIPGVGITSLPRSLHHRYWIFVEGPNFYNRGLRHYVLPWERNTTIINYTVVHTNIVERNRLVVNNGIDIDYVSRVSRQKISKHQMIDRSNAGQSNLSSGALEVYRPQIKERTGGRPGTVVKRSELRDKVSSARIKRNEAGESAEEAGLTRVQKKEMEIMQETQAKEVEDLKRKSDIKKRSAQSATEKKKIDKKHQEQEKSLKAKHSKESAQIQNRHKKERTSAAKTKVTKTKVKKKKKI